MNAYLLLENGLAVEGALFGQSQNKLGFVSEEYDGQFTLCCSQTDQICILAKASATLKEGQTAFFTKDMDTVVKALELNKGSGMLAKIVVDTLPQDYHLYDIKTHIHIGQKTTSKTPAEEGAA